MSQSRNMTKIFILFITAVVLTSGLFFRNADAATDPNGKTKSSAVILTDGTTPVRIYYSKDYGYNKDIDEDLNTHGKNTWLKYTVPADGFYKFSIDVDDEDQLGDTASDPNPVSDEEGTTQQIPWMCFSGDQEYKALLKENTVIYFHFELYRENAQSDSSLTGNFTVEYVSDADPDMTELKLGTQNCTFPAKTNTLNYSYVAFTAPEDGNYCFWYYLNTLEIKPREFESAVTVDDIGDSIFNESSLEDGIFYDDGNIVDGIGRRIVKQMKAGQKVIYALRLGTTFNGSAYNLDIKVTKVPEGQHVLGDFKVQTVTDGSMTRCSAIAECTATDCPYYVEWYAEFQTPRYTGKSVSPEIDENDISCDVNLFTKGMDIREELDQAGVYDLSRNHGFTVSFEKATDVRSQGKMIIHVTNQKAQAYVGKTIEFSYTVVKGDLSSGKASLKTTAFTYTGKTIKPVIASVKNSIGKALVNGTDYTVSCKSSKNVGTYTLIIKGKGNYTGTKKLTYKINPKGTSVKILKAGKKSFIIWWKKKTVQTTGYQIRYAKKSSMKNAKTVTVSGNKTTSKTVKSLKAKTKYYVQIRTFKRVSGKMYYSDWSSKKTVTVR